jgi:aminodeoxyfutalosine deaminase
VRKISATYIFPANGNPVKNGILECHNDGTIINLTDNAGRIKEQHGLEYYSGILVPGFINAHCHLELSHLKNKISEKSGLGDFLGSINKLRNSETESAEESARKADFRLWSDGIVAVGDISNTAETLETKSKSKIFYHTFAEAFGFLPSRAEKAFELACLTETLFREKGLRASVVPHSPYSVSKPLFKKIALKAKTDKTILTIHNQESKAELQFFQNGGGPLAEHMIRNLKIDISGWNPGYKNSLKYILSFLPAENQLLLVHNTFTTEKDLEELKKHRQDSNTFFVLCPNANLFIENQLPPVQFFRKNRLNICIGTDSLASNHQLSILAEMFTLQQNFSDLPLEEIIQWATCNGARALQIEDKSGSFEPGKKPGINLITEVDLQNLKLTGKSKVIKLA